MFFLFHPKARTCAPPLHPALRFDLFVVVVVLLFLILILCIYARRSIKTKG